MASMLRRNTIKFFLLVAVAVAFIHFVGDLSLQASFAIVAVMACSWSWVDKTVSPSFSAHFVSLEPRIGLMLIDLGFLDDERWKSLMQSEEPAESWSGLQLARNGTKAAILSVAPSGDNVVHWIDRKYYTSTLNINVDLEFVYFPEQFFPWSPDFFFRLGSGGYHMGIRVKHEWWEANQKRLESSGIIKHVDREHMLGMTRLTLAVLPDKVFSPFYNQWTKSLRDEAAAVAKAGGWEVQDVGNAEIGYFGESYSSKYGTIWLRPLPRGD